ncbi:E3 ubiquitin-protein ligase RNF34-like isoform X2 [Tachypleus tridentatus]|uniref:E3 ubiquitin-protein ligase RNF34-like isoform X2 n=1 Tax=Tachypleus tridentatus TaxID=6853 RepID=UPI003FD56125
MATKSLFKPLLLDDVESVDQINEMSVCQLKLILTGNFIDYKSINEKNELQDFARQLWKQKQQSRDVDLIKDEDLCKICMERMIDSVLLECGYMTSCTSCGKQLNECPICRQYIVQVVHVYKV